MNPNILAGLLALNGEAIPEPKKDERVPYPSDSDISALERAEARREKKNARRLKLGDFHHVSSSILTDEQKERLKKAGKLCKCMTRSID